jgi:ubiquinone/menaquinone biosynthesis C-methylase UbiE
MLDAACGSLVFTAHTSLKSDRPVIACDQSLDILRRACRRLRGLGGAAPSQVVLLQADVSDLPFRQNSFQTVLCMNVLHHVADGASLIYNLHALLASDGQLHLTSLVKNNRFVGDGYLNLLHKQGWIVRPKSEQARLRQQHSPQRHRSHRARIEGATGTLPFLCLTLCLRCLCG